MSDNKNIETKLQALGQSVEINRNFTNSVMQQVRSMPKPQAKSTNRFWRLIMEKPVRTLISTATAAAILIILMVILPSTNNGVFADVIEAMKNVTRCKSETKTYLPNKEEPVSSHTSWTDFDKKETYLLYDKGYIHHFDDKKHTKEVYVPETNTLTISFLEYNHLRDGGSMEAMFEEYAKKQKEEGIKVERRTDEIEGKKVEVIEMTETLNDIAPTPDIKMTIMKMNGQYVKYDKFSTVVDYYTNKPVSLIRYLYNHNNELISKDVSNLEFDTEFPKDMHELGMPQDVKIINKVPSGKVKETRDKVSKYQKEFLNKYVAVITESDLNDDGTERTIKAIVVNSNGKYLRVDVFRNIYNRTDEITGKYSEKLQHALPLIEQYCPDYAKLKISAVRFYDGLWQQNFDEKDNELVAQEKQRRPDGDGFSGVDIKDFGWMNLWQNLDPEYDFEDEYSSQNGLVALGIDSEAKYDNWLPKRQKLYIDPSKDYMFQRHVSERKVDADWVTNTNWKEGKDITKFQAEEVMVREVVEAAQTKSGCWYPKVITVKGYRQPLSRNAMRIPINRIIRIHLIEENQKLDKELFKPWE